LSRTGADRAAQCFRDRSILRRRTADLLGNFILHRNFPFKSNGAARAERKYGLQLVYENNSLGL
jgi:hypothetical protein